MAATARGACRPGRLIRPRAKSTRCRSRDPYHPPHVDTARLLGFLLAAILIPATPGAERRPLVELDRERGVRRARGADAGQQIGQADRLGLPIAGVPKEFGHGAINESAACARPSRQGTEALARPGARRSVAGGLATRLAPPVRPRAGLRAGEPERRAVLLRVSRQQSGFEVQLPRGDSRLGAGRQFLLVPGLCHQRAGHLQAPRIHARPAAEEAWRQGGVRARLPAGLFRALPAQ